MTRRRIIAAIAASLLIGLIINFGLAAWLGWRPLRSRTGSVQTVQSGPVSYSSWVEWVPCRASVTLYHTGPHTVPVEDLRDAYINAHPDGTDVDSYVAFPRGPRQQAAAYFPDWSRWAAGADPGTLRTVFAAGYPLKTLAAYEARPAFGATPVESGFLLRNTFDPFRFIPGRPILRGTAVNSALFASPWLLLFIGVPAARRRLRLRRGQCPACSYDLRADFPAGCPECGWNRAQALVT